MTVASNAGALWTVHKRYSDFENLHNTLGKMVSGRLPGKKYFGGNLTEQLVTERMQGLNDYVQATLANPAAAWAPALASFLAKGQELTPGKWVIGKWDAEWANAFMEELSRWKTMRGKSIERDDPVNDSAVEAAVAQAQKAWNKERCELQVTISEMDAERRELRKQIEKLQEEIRMCQPVQKQGPDEQAVQRQEALLREVASLKEERALEETQSAQREQEFQEQMQHMQNEFQAMLQTKQDEIYFLKKAVPEPQTAPMQPIVVPSQPAPRPTPVPALAPKPTSSFEEERVLSTKERVLKAKADRLAREHEDRLRELAAAQSEQIGLMCAAAERAKGEFEVTRRNSADIRQVEE